MHNVLNGVTSVAGRVMLTAIFLTSALFNKIPNFDGVAGYMASHGVPAPRLLLAGAIVFLLLGGASLVLGFQARVGALLLLVFLVAATYFFHDFWTLTDAQQKQGEMIHFMKNVGLMGAILLIAANGTGAWSLDNRRLASTAE